MIHLAGPGTDFMKWNNTGVYRNFACAKGPVFVPDSFKPLQKNLPCNQKIYPLVLATTNSESNAYVGWFPRKSQWYNTPSQDDLSGTGEWFNLLATHEGRHMVQYDKFNVGFTKFAGIVCH